MKPLFNCHFGKLATILTAAFIAAAATTASAGSGLSQQPILVRNSGGNLITVKIGEPNMESKADCTKFKGEIVMIKKVAYCRFVADGVIFAKNYSSSRSNKSR